MIIYFQKKNQEYILASGYRQAMHAPNTLIHASLSSLFLLPQIESMQALVVKPMMTNAVTCKPKTTVPSPKIIKKKLNIEYFLFLKMVDF